MNTEFTSDVIRSTKFRDKLRGYHPDDVDAFLERAAAALELVQSRLAEMTERALKAEAALESNSEADESIRRTLTLAQRTAELAVREATEDAERIRAEAASDARTQRQETDEECHRLVEESQANAEAVRTQADAALDDARQRADTMVADAERQATDRRRACEETIATAEQEAAERQRATAEAAERELQALVDNLSAQRHELRTHVEALAGYLASERARVLTVLSDATERFADSLSSSPRPGSVDAGVEAAARAAAVANEAGVVNELDGADKVHELDEVDEVSFPTAPSRLSAFAAALAEETAETGPAAVWFPDATEPLIDVLDESDHAETVALDADDAGDTRNDGDDERQAPAALLFTLGDDSHRPLAEPYRPSPEPADANRSRKSLLGRRRG